MKLNGASQQSKHITHQENNIPMNKIETFYYWDWVTWWQKSKQKGNSWRKLFFKKRFIIKVIKRNGYKLNGFSSLLNVSLSLSVICLIITEWNTNIRKSFKKINKFCERTVSGQKHKLFNKNNEPIQIHIFSNLLISQLYFSSSGLVNYVINGKRNKMNPQNVQLCSKKLILVVSKTRIN